MPLYDLHISIVDPTKQSFGANFSFNLGAPIKVSGKYKLINRWLKLFFTPKGSQPVRRAEGTDFAYLIGGNVLDIDSLQATVVEYIDDASDQIKSIDARSPWLTSDERLREVNVLQFNQIDTTRIEFWVEVIAMSGVRQTVLIPYSAG